MKLNHPWLVTLLIAACSTLLFIWPACYNGYPLFYSDSGTYMRSSIELEMPMDRPLFYGIFLRITAMQARLWVPVVVQGFITWWILNRTMKRLFPDFGWIAQGSVYLLLAVLTGLPWYTAQIMPDLFTALAVLLVYLIYADRPAPTPIRITYFILLFVAIGTHFSNTLIVGLVAGTVVLVCCRRIYRNQDGFRASSLGIFAVLGVVSLAHCLCNYVQYDTFRMSRGTNLFLVAKCCETPLLITYMRENHNHIAFPFPESEIDSIPNSACGFLWEAKSPLNNPNVDRIAMNTAFGPVMEDLLSQPKYRNWFIREAFASTWTQLHMHRVGSGLVPYRENTPPYALMESEFRSELPQYRNAFQQRHTMEINYHRFISNAVYCCSVLIIIVGSCFRVIRSKLGLFIGIVVLGVVANAFITASLANVYDRLQVRVVWLTTFLAIVICMELFRYWKAARTPPQKATGNGDGL